MHRPPDVDAGADVELLAGLLDRAGGLPLPEEPVPTSLTVLVRTQGARPALLRGALTSLAAQHDQRLDVRVVVHHDGARPDLVDDVARDAERHGPPGVAVLDARGGRRARPLTVGLEGATGDLVTCLDDDDLADPSWSADLLRAGAEHPGALVRCRVRLQPAALDDDGRPVPTGEAVLTDATYDAVTVMTRSQTPNCAVAFPRRSLRAAGGWREDLDVLEDWELLLRLAPLCGVVETGTVAATYHRWAHDSRVAVGDDRWQATRAAVLAERDAEPLLLPPGSVATLVAQQEAAQQLREARGALTAARARLAALEASTSWRVTAPLRAVLDRVRR